MLESEENWGEVVNFFGSILFNLLENTENKEK